MKVSPYHTSVLHTRPRNATSTTTTTRAGREALKPEHKTAGTAGRPLCDDCSGFRRNVNSQYGPHGSPSMIAQ